MHIIRRIVFYGLLVLIALAPLPFGSNRPWAWSLLSLWVGVLVLLDAVAVGFDPVRGESRFMRRIALPFLLFVPVVIWIILQATPDIFSDIAHPIWSEVSAQLGQMLPNYVTISPEMTRDAVMVLLAYAGVFWLAARHGRDRKNASVMLKFFVIVSTCYAIYGLVVYFGGWEKILWYEKTSYRGDLTGTFVNRNSYATYAAMGFIAAVVMLVSVFPKVQSTGDTKREVLRQMIDRVLKNAWLPFLGLVTIGTALMLSHSRAGFASGIIGLFSALTGLFLARVLYRKIVGWVVGGVVCLVIMGFGVSGKVLEQRYERSTADQGTRFAVYDRVTDAIELSPTTGYGYGTFEAGFRQFKQQDVGWATWQLAHNSFLEFSFGAGSIALLVCLLVFVLVFKRSMVGIFARHSDQIYPILGSASLLTVGAHSFWDFSVQIPGVGICFMFIIALGWSQSWPKHPARR